MQHILRTTAYVLGVSAIAAMLAACGGQLSSSIPAPQSAVQPSSSFVRPAHHHGSSSLLYVSNVGDSTVTVYAPTSGKPVSTLEVPPAPEGECTNSAGTVWIVNEDAAAIVEYAHDNTKEVAKLADPGNYPSGCSVSPKTGDLAVANIASNNGGPAGDLAIYADAKGSPTIYQNENIYRYYYCGYDSSGDLFVDGIQQDGKFVFAELPSGASKLTVLTLKESISTPGGVEWDGKHITVGDASTSTIYQLSISGNTASVVGTVGIKGGNAAAYYVDGTDVVALIAGSSEVGTWKYPAGGKPTSTLKLTGTDEPFDVVVSE